MDDSSTDKRANNDGAPDHVDLSKALNEDAPDTVFIRSSPRVLPSPSRQKKSHALSTVPSSNFGAVDVVRTGGAAAISTSPLNLTRMAMAATREAAGVSPLSFVLIFVCLSLNTST